MWLSSEGGFRMILHFTTPSDGRGIETYFDIQRFINVRE